MTWLKGALALSVLSAASWAMAADHIDAPGAIADPTADITDLYSWTDQGNVVFALNVTPFAKAGMAKFSDKVQYVIHTESSMSFGKPGEKVDIIVTFDAAQKASVWIGDTDYVSGDASDATKGLTSANGKFKVFTGLRDDPFFFNLAGFQETVKAVDDAVAANLLTFDPAGCPALSAMTSTGLVTQLKSAKGGGPAVDTFAGQNVLSIVLSVDKKLLTAGGPIMAAWASTNVGG
jgi:hypothetical protein